MTLLSAPTELVAWWRGHRFGERVDEPSTPSILSWMRTVVLPDDLLYLDIPGSAHASGLSRFPFPSLPSSRPLPTDPRDGTRHLRFVVIAVDRGSPPSALRAKTRELAARLPLSGFRPVVSMRRVVVLERDAPHPKHRPHRLGLSLDEGSWLLARTRAEATRFLANDPEGTPARSFAGTPPEPAPARLRAQRVNLAIAVWTRGRIRGSVVLPPGPVARAVQNGAKRVCQDTRFEPMTAADLEESVFQVGFVHAPGVPLQRREMASEDAYPDKALFLSEGTRSGVYLPEVHNVLPERRLKRLVQSLARDKAGIALQKNSAAKRGDSLRLGPGVIVLAHEVSEAIERRDRTGALLLDGPVARPPQGDARGSALAAGRAACTWLAAVQRNDGSLPTFVRPGDGAAEQRHGARMAMTAEALLAFAETSGPSDAAVKTARGVLAWLDRAKGEWNDNPAVALVTAAYRGKAAARLGEEADVRLAVKEVKERLEGTDTGPLPLSHALSLFEVMSSRVPEVANRAEALERELADRFARARQSEAALSLAEWAELAAVRPKGKTSREVARWLRAQQLSSGAFPDTTVSDFAYTRGTGKIFEALAARRDNDPGSLDSAVGWLLSMQYTVDSAFFVPDEHKSRVLGGFRHDYFNVDAWIDSAGHLLLGLARYLSP